MAARRGNVEGMSEDPQREGAPLDDHPDRGNLPIRDPDFARRAKDDDGDEGSERSSGDDGGDAPKRSENEE
jgi:hypothetical protein